MLTGWSGKESDRWKDEGQEEGEMGTGSVFLKLSETGEGADTQKKREVEGLGDDRSLDATTFRTSLYLRGSLL